MTLCSSRTHHLSGISSARVSRASCTSKSLNSPRTITLKMAAARSALRLTTRLATMPRPSAFRPATLNLGQRALISSSAPRPKSEVIKETEVPVSVYSPDAKGVASSTSDHFSIPVRPSPVTQPPHSPEEVEDRVYPLTNKVYASMPPTMKKMSVMDKVIIVTG